MINLRQLQYFIEVAEHQSVTRAAALLHVAQPALTRHMRALERDLGVQLFSRKGRGLELTHAGAAFRDRSRSILRDLDRARVEAKALSRGPDGRIDVGMPASISQALTRVLIERLAEMRPPTAVRVIDGWTGFIVEWLLLGRLDIGIIYDYASRSNLLHVEPLAIERQFLICSGDDPMAKAASIPLSEIPKLALALPSRDHGMRVAIEQQIRAAGVEPKVVMEIESVIAIKQFTEAGKYYTFLPRGEIGEEIRTRRLAAIPTEPAIYRTLSLAWPHERSIDEPIRALLQVIRRETAQLIKCGAWGTTFVEPSY
jgi:LysR family nitrogen assimilation transcriptional regulator